MDYTAQIAALEAALASGELTVETDGNRVTYRSTADLQVALDYFRRQQRAASGRQRGRTLISFGR